MDTWMMISMSAEYFRSIQSSESDGCTKEFSEESLEFWWFADELLRSGLQMYSLRPFNGAETGGGGPDAPALLVTLATSGALVQLAANLVQCLIKYLERNEKRELTIERGKTKLTLKGRSLYEEKELLRMLFPELIEGQGVDKRKV
jgi:hypothetical protein